MKNLILASLAVISISFSVQYKNTLIANIQDDEVYDIYEDISLQDYFAKYPPIVANRNLDTVGLYYKDKRFHILYDGGDHKVQNAYIDKILRNINEEKLEAFLTNGGYLVIDQFTDGEFNIKAKIRGLGGGVWGAWAGAVLGKAAVSIVCHGSIYLVSAGVGVFCPPAGIAVGIGLTSTLGASIEAASMAGAMAVGIAGAVATGPV